MKRRVIDSVNTVDDNGGIINVNIMQRIPLCQIRYRRERRKRYRITECLNHRMSEKVASGRCSPNKFDKMSSSSESSIHFDFNSNVPSELFNEGKIRPSSWDESDGDESIERERSAEGTQLHSTESQKFKASVAAEINELKKQFFESLQKLKNSNNEPLDMEKKMMDLKSEDRRQCPARVRRRTKSSSSLSPLLETRNQNSAERSEEELDQVSDGVKSNTPDSKYYLNNFFNELRTKRISATYPSFVSVKPDEEDSESKNQDEAHISPSGHLTSVDSSDSDTNYCKTARKLSKIMEVEENRRDPDKSLEETSKNTWLFSKNFNTPEKSASPFQSARSIGEKASRNFKDFKSLSFEELEEDSEYQKPFRGSVSERSRRIFRKKQRDNFALFSTKSPKFRIKSPKLFERKTSKSPKNLNSFNGQSDNDSSFKEDEKENVDSIGCLKADSTKKLNFENPTPRSSDRSDRSNRSNFDRSTRTRSVKSRNSNIESPNYRINTDRESVKSLRLEDVNTPDSLKQDLKSESKTILSQDRSPRKSRRQSSSGNSSERKSERNLKIPLESLSVESLKSSNSKESELNSSKSHKSKSTERSSKKGQIKTDDFLVEINKPVEGCSLAESSRSYKIPISSRIGSPVEENFKNESERSTIRSHKSSRSSRSGKTNSPKSSKRFFGDLLDEVTPPPELELPLDISESHQLSYRRVRASDSSISKNSSRRSSERSSASKSKSAGKMSSRTNDRVSNRSKEKFENTNESPHFETNPWSESENIMDALTHRSSSEISSRRSSGRAQNTSSRQNSPQKRASDLERSTLNTPKNITEEFIEERQSISEKSSRRSAGSTRNSSPTKSIKFSPNTEAYEESRFPDIEKLCFEVGNATMSNKISSVSEEDVQETCSSQRLKSECESDRFSEKRLSIINEVSIEDLAGSNDSLENEDCNRQPSFISSKRERSTTNRSLKNTARSQKETAREKTDDEEWNELIETFSQNPDPSFILERTLSGSPYKSEPSWYADGKNDSGDKKNISARDAQYKKEIYSENQMEEGEELKNFHLDYEENSLEMPIKKNMRTLQNLQNLYYCNVNEQEPFRIGECGDVTNWNADKSDTPEKPKAYGDGMILQNTSEVLALIGTKEKEVKTQRQLWTDLRGDSRSSKQKLHKLMSELEDDANFNKVISPGLQISKSDNCINAIKNGDGDASKRSEPSEAKSNSEVGTFEGQISTAKNASEVDFESIEYEKEEIENIEFDCATARRSRSMIDLNTQFENENFEDIQLNSNFNSSASMLFERASVLSKKEKESTNLNIFLARNQKEEKTAIKSNNWLNFKALEPEKSSKKNKKIKRKRKDIIVSPKEKENHQEYLYTAKSRPPVPVLKLRNSSCFQNFYKRIVSVFCLTTHSSADTSK